MKISNFELIETRGNRSVIDRVYIAEVDVTTGFFTKKTERVRIAREYANFWFWENTGKFCPSNVVEQLARAYAVKTGKEC